jgi:SOS-response transcriptional repressor LexA
MNPITQRFFDALKAAGLSAYRISEDIPTISQARISNARTGKNEIGLDVVSSVCSFYPSINSDYIITGNGTPIHEAEMNTRQRVGIPLVSQYAYGGYLTGYGDAEYLQSLPLIDFIPDRSMSGNYLAFEVRGDSMDDGTKDGYEQGEILICREVAPHLWKDSKLHIHRRDFVIVHADGILIKRIIDHDVTRHTIVIHSLNPTYQDKEIDLADVRQLFSVIESRRQRAR